MTIREYIATDKNYCLAAFESNMPRYFFPNELEDFRQFLDIQVTSGYNENETGRYYVVERDGRVIGCGGFVLNHTAKDARMTWGLIHNDAHHQGLGKELLLWRIKEIRALSEHCTIALDTTQYTAAFFEKMGFKTIAVTENFYGPGMHRYDMVQEPMKYTK